MSAADEQPVGTRVELGTGGPRGIITGYHADIPVVAFDFDDEAEYVVHPPYSNFMLISRRPLKTVA